MLEAWVAALPASKFHAVGILLGIFIISRTIVKIYSAHCRSVPGVPVVGRNGIIGSWISAIRFYADFRALVQEGYEKHGDFIFQVPTFTRWEFFICNEEMVAEYLSAPDEQVSFHKASSENLVSKYTCPSADVCKFDTNAPLLRGLGWLRGRSITKTDPYFSELVEEMVYSLEQEVDFDKDGRATINTYTTSARIIAQMTAKALVGRPLCKDPEIVDIFCRYAISVVASARIIRSFPQFMQPIVARFCAAPRLLEQMIQKITSDITKKRQNTPKEPEDLSDWYVKYLAQNVPADLYSDRDICLQIAVNVFASIFTTNTFLVQSLYEIAYRPEYVEPLRDEIAEALREHGSWTKKALESMKKLDSFIKEVQRYYPLDFSSNARKVVEDFTFKNGLRIPRGNQIQSLQGPLLRDERYYPDPNQFDGFRFYKLGVDTGKPNDHRIASLDSRFRVFGGQGKHACPGRFHAADEIRMILGYLLFNYDIAFKDNAKSRPPDMVYIRVAVPNTKGEIMLRKRKGAM